MAAKRCKCPAGRRPALDEHNTAICARDLSTVIRPKTRDGDRDGVADTVDRCPEDAEDKDGFEDKDGCPDPDNDGDQVPDYADGCPLVAEDRDRVRDDDGCPEDATAESEAARLVQSAKTQMEQGEYNLAAQSLREARRLTPEAPSPALYLGIALAHLGRCDEARGELRLYVSRTTNQEQIARANEFWLARCQGDAALQHVVSPRAPHDSGAPGPVAISRGINPRRRWWGVGIALLANTDETQEGFGIDAGYGVIRGNSRLGGGARLSIAGEDPDGNSRDWSLSAEFRARYRAAQGKSGAVDLELDTGLGIVADNRVGQDYRWAKLELAPGLTFHLGGSTSFFVSFSVPLGVTGAANGYIGVRLSLGLAGEP